MVDLAIAANFVRELTEDQFAKQPRARRREAPASPQELGSPHRQAHGSPYRQARASGHNAQARDRQAVAEPAGVRPSGTRVGRVLSRLIQARG